MSLTRSALPAVALLAIATTAVPLVAQRADTLPTLYSSGSASYRVDADAVDLVAMIEGTGNSATQAANPCANVVDSVRATLTRFGLRPVDFAVLQQGVGPVTNQYGTPNIPDRFMARASVRIHLSDISQLRRLTAALLDAGAARMTALHYSSSRAEEARQAAFDSAAALASLRGQRLARAVGGRLLALREVSASDANPADAYQGYPVDQDQSAKFLAEVRGQVVVNLTWTYSPTTH